MARSCSSEQSGIRAIVNRFAIFVNNSIPSQHDLNGELVVCGLKLNRSACFADNLLHVLRTKAMECRLIFCGNESLALTSYFANVSVVLAGDKQHIPYL